MADIVNPGTVAGGPLNQGAMPGNYDLVIYKGDYVDIRVTVKDEVGNPINLTGYTPKAQLRTNYDAVSAIDFTTTLVSPTAGQVKIYLSSATSSTLVPGPYIWDFQVADPSGEVRTYLTGDVTVYNEVTT